MNHTIETISDFSEGRAFISIPGSMVSNIIIDHRDIHWKGAMFAAFKGSRTDGHGFIPKLIEQGVHHFLVSSEDVITSYRDRANFILVEDVTLALQKIAAKHRAHFDLPLVAITGSNGKTIVKEWLNTLLENRYTICRSPKSFNSQIGVPLSVFQLQAQHTLGIFEAGISKPGEMANLEAILKPTIGVFTNLGDAHAAHFAGEESKFREKWLLFRDAKRIVCCADQQWFQWLTTDDRKRCFTWSFTDPEADVRVHHSEANHQNTVLVATYKNQEVTINVPFTDKASIENAMQCFCTVVLLGHLDGQLLEGFENLMQVAMRMEVKAGIEQSVLIDDSYNADLGSLKVALEQLGSFEDREHILILTDLSDNVSSPELYTTMARLVKEAGVSEMVGIGPEIERHKAAFSSLRLKCYLDIDAYWHDLNPRSLRNKAILIKGARKFKLEQLVKRLQAQQHETVLEVDLHKLTENLRLFKANIRPGVKIMVMVKAFSYGSGGFEVAGFLQTQNVDYLAVAYTDEGVDLRRRGVRMPIMVMSPSKAAYESMIKYDLEPEIYSLRSLAEFIESARALRHMFESLSLHLKIDSGMHRLGFEKEDMEEVISLLKTAPFVKVASVFTHLSASDNPHEDDFTRTQVQRFLEIAEPLERQLGYRIMKHALNSTGILRFPEFQMDMVRLGIGLYGFSGTTHNKFLHSLGAFKSYIIQVRNVDAHQSVGYNRNGRSDKQRKIATVAVGYADGLDRRLGSGKWSLKWQGVECPIVGNVCMDMCMIDVTGTNAREGDEVTIFGGADEVEKMATLLETIPYEILTKISQRVRRVFLHE